MFDICKRHDEGGAKTLADKLCGRPVGVLRALSEEQERDIRRVPSLRKPRQVIKPFHRLKMCHGIVKLHSSLRAPANDFR